MAFYPYLNFGGNCAEAFTRYQQIFGGDLVLLKMSNMPEGAPTVPAEAAHLIMHAALTVGDGLLMASDSPPGEFKGIDGAWVNFSTADVGEAERVFKELSDGGQVTMPLGETFFSPMFGLCADRFGVLWMVNTTAPDQT
jgi:PhnB protein